MVTSLWPGGRGETSPDYGAYVQPDFCCSSLSRRTELGPTFGVRCLITGAPTSNSLSLGLSVPTCPQRTRWSLQAGGGSFLPWSVPDEQAGASCCGCSGYKGLQSPDALCDDGKGLHLAGWRWHPRWTIGKKGAQVTLPFPFLFHLCLFFQLLKPPDASLSPGPSTLVFI